MQPRARLLAAAVLLTCRARAEEPPARRLDVAGSLGYAAPIASAEHGARIGDTTLGALPIALDVSYRLTPSLAIVAYAGYGIGLPTLCKGATECARSLGSDVALALRVRFFLPRYGKVEPHLDAGSGYEWFASTLSDGGVTVTRSYRGPLLLSTEIAAPFRLAPRFTLGPTVGGAIGAFTRYRLDASAASREGPVPSHALHAWLSCAARVSLQF